MSEPLFTINERVVITAVVMPEITLNESGIAYALEFVDGTPLRYVDEEHLRRT